MHNYLAVIHGFQRSAKRGPKRKNHQPQVVISPNLISQVREVHNNRRLNEANVAIVPEEQRENIALEVDEYQPNFRDLHLEKQFELALEFASGKH
jgi:hypothetical protein